MKTDKARWLRIVATQLEVYDFVSLHLKVVRHHLRKVAQMTLFEVENIIGDPLDIFAKKVVDNAC